VDRRDFMEPLWLIIAFAFGFAARQVHLPPLVGFLVAGLVLHAIGVERGSAIQYIADVGVSLLLFSIGLKLHVKQLLRPEIWAGTSLHMLVTVVVFGAAIYGASLAGIPPFGGLAPGVALLIAFALSFSSTVFAVKVLEDKGETNSLHGRIAIGILIMQDVVAVLFLVFSTGKIPSPWAFALLGLPLIRPVLTWVMERSGHGEVLVLYGFFVGFLGSWVFELVDIKADLGALTFGVLLAHHPKAKEVAREIMGFKDLFLVGFFLNIGLYGPPDLTGVITAVVLVLAVPLKVALFFALLARFRLRARTALLTALSLANYSEFGLIVAATGTAAGWLGDEWMVILATALSISFVVASPPNALAHRIYALYEAALRRFETQTRLPGDELIDPGNARVIIFGMGRVGTRAYEIMRERVGEVLGVEWDPDTVRQHTEAGRNVILGDGTDSDFWSRTNKDRRGAIEVVMLALPRHVANVSVATRLINDGYPGFIAATAQHADDIAELEALGVQAVFNFYAEAGAGFAEHVCERLEVSQAK
jgi:predicted Kef-type K+ transport protein